MIFTQEIRLKLKSNKDNTTSVASRAIQPVRTNQLPNLENRLVKIAGIDTLHMQLERNGS